MKNFLSAIKSNHYKKREISEIYGIIGSIPCGCIECITAPVPPALIVPFNSDLEIYPFVTSHAV